MHGNAQQENKLEQFMPGTKKKWDLELGSRAADKFINGILETVDLLALNPNMGSYEPETETCKRNYRSFVEHKNHKIIYYVEKKTIYIVSIWPNSQNPESFIKQLK